MATNRQWKPYYLVKIYQLAAQGLIPEDIASALNVNQTLFTKWLKDKPDVKRAYKEGCEAKRATRNLTVPENEKAVDLDSWLYGRLSPEMRQVWKEIKDSDLDSQDDQDAVDALLRGKPKAFKQRLFLQALVESGWDRSTAARRVGISLATIRHWVREDPGFKQLVEEIQEHKADYLETSLMRLVAMGNESAILFANKTLNRDRGYGEKVTVEHTGSVQNNHVVVSVGELDLPRETQRTILDRLKEQKAQQIAQQERIPEIINTTARSKQPD